MKKVLALLSLAGLMVLSGCCCKKKADAGKCTQKKEQGKPCDKRDKSCTNKKCDGKKCDGKACDKKDMKKKDAKQADKKKSTYGNLKPARLQFDDVPALPLVG